MARPLSLKVLLVVGCLVCLAVGVGFAATCDGGYSLILFGASLAFLGALLYREGAWATVIPFALMVLVLAGGGYYGLTVAGCGL